MIYALMVLGFTVLGFVLMAVLFAGFFLLMRKLEGDYADLPYLD